MVPRIIIALAVTLATPLAAQTVTPQARITDLEAQLKRQSVIADNARQEVALLRADLKLRDELLILARQRNAELHATALEVIDLGLASRSREPLVQLRRVKMENLKQSFEDRLNAAQIHDTTLPPSVQARMDAELKAKRPPPVATAAPRN